MPNSPPSRFLMEAAPRKCRWGIMSTAGIATKNVLAMKASPNATVVVRHTHIPTAADVV